MEIFSTALLRHQSGLLVLATRGFVGMLCFSPGRRFPGLVTARGVDCPDCVDGKDSSTM